MSAPSNNVFATIVTVALLVMLITCSSVLAARISEFKQAAVDRGYAKFVTDGKTINFVWIDNVQLED